MSVWYFWHVFHKAGKADGVQRAQCDVTSACNFVYEFSRQNKVSLEKFSWAQDGREHVTTTWK